VGGGGGGGGGARFKLDVTNPTFTVARVPDIYSPQPWLQKEGLYLSRAF
jgi:hypothetical protein